MMDRIIGLLTDTAKKGGPTAIVVALVFLWGIQPVNTRLEQVDTKLNTRIDQVITLMNREVIPLVNELKKGKPIPGPEIKSLTRLQQRLAETVASLDAELKKSSQAVAAAAQSIVKTQEGTTKEIAQVRASIEAQAKASKELSGSLDETRKLVLAAAVAPLWRPDIKWKAGDTFYPGAALTAGHFGPESYNQGWRGGVAYSADGKLIWPQKDKELRFVVKDPYMFNQVSLDSFNVFNKLGLVPEVATVPPVPPNR